MAQSPLLPASAVPTTLVPGRLGRSPEERARAERGMVPRRT